MMQLIIGTRAGDADPVLAVLELDGSVAG